MLAVDHHRPGHDYLEKAGMEAWMDVLFLITRATLYAYGSPRNARGFIKQQKTLDYNSTMDAAMTVMNQYPVWFLSYPVCEL